MRNFRIIIHDRKQRKKKQAGWRIVFVGLCLSIGTILSLWGRSREASAKVYKEGFSYKKIDEEIKERMDGVSYHKNSDISYDDLRYLKVKYYNFKGNVKNGEMVVNKKIALRTVKIFYKLYQRKYPIQRMKLIDDYGGDDEKSMSANNSSAFNYRKIAGKKKLSNHAFGMAIDINPKINPYITSSGVAPKNGKVYANRNKKSCKGKYAEYMITKNSEIVKLFKKNGFSWGGDWKNSKDYQHFEYKKK